MINYLYRFVLFLSCTMTYFNIFLKVSRLNFSKDEKKKKDETNVEKQIIEKVIEIPFWYYKN